MQRGTRFGEVSEEKSGAMQRQSKVRYSIASEKR